MIHCGTTNKASHPSTLARVARRFSGVQFVFAHMGGTNIHQTAEAGTFFNVSTGNL
jgi:hypothetical protein